VSREITDEKLAQILAVAAAMARACNEGDEQAQLSPEEVPADVDQLLKESQEDLFCDLAVALFRCTPGWQLSDRLAAVFQVVDALRRRFGLDL
jgi:hypothetical protein